MPKYSNFTSCHAPVSLYYLVCEQMSRNKVFKNVNFILFFYVLYNFLISQLLQEYLHRSKLLPSFLTSHVWISNVKGK